MLRRLALLPLLMVIATSAAAQGSLRSENAQPSAGPRVASASVGVRPLSTAKATVTAPPAAPSKNQSQVLIIVGGAAFIGGLLIGDDAGTAIAIAGLGVGIYGLYYYLRY